MTDDAKRTPDRAIGRREAMVTAAKAAGAACAGGFLLTALARSAAPRPAHALRPPGAIDEAQFSGACVRCGLCVRACPYDTLKLAELGDEVALGTPYFEARKVPCFMCKDIPCTRACPTGALDPALERIEDAEMGVAVLTDHENCLNYRGMHCSVCYRVCPIRDQAITLVDHIINDQLRLIPTVHADKCTGCGRCENQCVLKETAIRVLPRRLARGAVGVNPAGRRS